MMSSVSDSDPGEEVDAALETTLSPGGRGTPHKSDGDDHRTF